MRKTRRVRSPLRLAEPPVPPGFTGTRLTACNLCEAICGLELTLTDGKVTGIRGNPDDPLSRGYICPKGVALADVYDDPDRLRRPVRRVSTGSTTRTTARPPTGVGGDRLGRGARPRRRRPGRRPQPARPRRRRRLPRQPQRPRARLGDPRGALREVAAHPQPLQRLDGRPGAAPAGRLADVRPPAAAPDPRPGPHVVPPRARRQPDGLQRLADDRARLPEPGQGDQAARRADRGARPAPHRDRHDRDRAPLRPARAATSSCCSRCCARSSPRGWRSLRRTSTGSSELRALVDGFTPTLAEQVSGVPAETVERLARELCETPGRRGVRPARRLRDRLRLGQPVGDQLPEPPRPATSTGRAG